MRFAENVTSHPKLKLAERQTLATLGGGKERERSFPFPSQRPFRMVEKSEKGKKEKEEEGGDFPLTLIILGLG